jgi:hypothetical protein
MDKPKTELAYRVPASKITKKNMYEEGQVELEGLDTTIDWKNTSDNSYDGEKLILLVEDESGKLEVPNNILNGWRIRKTCLRLGSRIIGKCMMGSTPNALAKGGANFKKLYNDSNIAQEITTDRQSQACILCIYQWSGILRDILIDTECQFSGSLPNQS